MQHILTQMEAYSHKNQSFKSAAFSRNPFPHKKMQTCWCSAGNEGMNLEIPEHRKPPVALPKRKGSWTHMVRRRLQVDCSCVKIKSVINLVVLPETCFKNFQKVSRTNLNLSPGFEHVAHVTSNLDSVHCENDTQMQASASNGRPRTLGHPQRSRNV